MFIIRIFRTWKATVDQSPNIRSDFLAVPFEDYQFPRKASCRPKSNFHDNWFPTVVRFMSGYI